MTLKTDDLEDEEGRFGVSLLAEGGGGLGRKMRVAEVEMGATGSVTIILRKRSTDWCSM